jgi:hypothetical protein
VKDICKNHCKAPSEKTKTLLQIMLEIDNFRSNNDEIIASDDDIESVINISTEDHINIIEHTNKQIIENNITLKTFNSVIDTKKSLQSEFRHLIISNIATETSKDIKFSDYIFYYILFHIMEVAEFGPIVNKYGWVYAITRLGDDLIEMVNDSGDEYIDFQLSKLGVDISGLKESSNKKKFLKMKEYNHNINVEWFSKNLLIHKTRIKRMIWTRLCWIIDYFAYILLLKKTDIDTNFDNLHDFADILNYSLNCRLHLFTHSGFNDPTAIKEETNLKTIVVKCYQKFSSRENNFMNIDVLNSQMRALINNSLFAEMKIILHVVSRHSPIVDYKTDVRIKDLASSVDDLQVLHSVIY